MNYFVINLTSMAAISYLRSNDTCYPILFSRHVGTVKFQQKRCSMRKNHVESKFS